MNINNYLNSKLVLGTASFTKNYSLFKKKIPNGEIIKIFNEMTKNKIFMIDTATRYFDISKRAKKDRLVIKAFQQKFSPNKITGKIDLKLLKISHFLANN